MMLLLPILTKNISLYNDIIVRKNRKSYIDFNSFVIRRKF